MPRRAPETRQDAHPTDQKKAKVFDIERDIARGGYYDCWEAIYIENEQK